MKQITLDRLTEENMGKLRDYVENCPEDICISVEAVPKGDILDESYVYDDVTLSVSNSHIFAKGCPSPKYLREHEKRKNGVISGLMDLLGGFLDISSYDYSK